MARPVRGDVVVGSVVPTKLTEVVDRVVSILRA
jgi:hypothetical protein